MKHEALTGHEQDPNSIVLYYFLHVRFKQGSIFVYIGWLFYMSIL